MAPPGSRLTVGNGFVFQRLSIEDTSYVSEGRRVSSFKTNVILQAPNGEEVYLSGVEGKERKQAELQSVFSLIRLSEQHSKGGSYNRVTPEFQKLYEEALRVAWKVFSEVKPGVVSLVSNAKRFAVEPVSTDCKHPTRLTLEGEGIGVQLFDSASCEGSTDGLDYVSVSFSLDGKEVSFSGSVWDGGVIADLNKKFGTLLQSIQGPYDYHGEKIVFSGSEAKRLLDPAKRAEAAKLFEKYSPVLYTPQDSEQRIYAFKGFLGLLDRYEKRSDLSLSIDDYIQREINAALSLSMKLTKAKGVALKIGLGLIAGPAYLFASKWMELPSNNNYRVLLDWVGSSHLDFEPQGKKISIDRSYAMTLNPQGERIPLDTGYVFSVLEDFIRGEHSDSGFKLGEVSLHNLDAMLSVADKSGELQLSNASGTITLDYDDAVVFGVGVARTMLAALSKSE